MQSESARMASAAEARFRIDAPNSKPRAIKVIALDRPSDRVVKRLAQATWNQASFFTASAFAGTPQGTGSFSMTGWLSVVAGAAASDEALAKTLAQLRPWSLMLVIASADDYIEDILTALRA